MVWWKRKFDLTLNVMKTVSTFFKFGGKVNQSISGIGKGVILKENDYDLYPYETYSLICILTLLSLYNM